MQQTGDLGAAKQQFPRHGGVEDTRSAGQFGGPLPDRVHLNVVTVAVAAVRLVTEKHVGVLLAEDVGQLLGGLVDVGAGEAHSAGRIGIEVLAVAAVRVVEAHHPRRAEFGSAGPQFIEAVDGLVVVDLPVGRDDHHHAVTVLGQPREGAAGQDDLVIGVGMECDDGGHGQCSP